MLRSGLDYFQLEHFDLLIVENVGNLVCPANFKLGTHKNILISSIPEGDDKPYKYPGMFRGVDILILNKFDLLPYVSFNMNSFISGVKMLNSNVVIIPLSCVNGDGIDMWTTWIKSQININKNLSVHGG